jgi:cell pole-organizing protein PopZ
MMWRRIAGRRAGSPEREELPGERDELAGGKDVTSEPREQQEPSMEEILSSIRRIIADEETDDKSGGDDELGTTEAGSEALGTGADTLARAAADDDDADEDVLELTKVVRDTGEVIDFQGERASADAAWDDDEARHDDAQPLQVAPADPIPEEPVGTSRDPIERKDQVVHNEPARASELMSAATASVAGGAFAKLSEALQRTPEAESVADSSGRTVEQFFEDIARPILKEWLDANLPAIVERLVQKEIQKIARRADLM